MGAQNTFKDLQNFISDYLSEFLHEAGITLCVCVQKKKPKTKQEHKQKQQNKSFTFVVRSLQSKQLPVVNK